jgi:probable phosphoglycerate mutase/uncharacterized phosphatase
LGKTTVYLIRHGQTDWNVERRLQGHLDVPLNQVGIRQAEKVAKRFEPDSLDAIYSSDLRRARMTAEIIAAPHRLTVWLHQGLRERGYGPFEGKRWDEIPEFHAGFRSDLLTAEGVESWRQMQQRAVKALEEIISRHLGQRVAVVTHGGTINAILSYLEGHAEPRYRIANTSVTCLTCGAEEWTISWINDASHWDEVS